MCFQREREGREEPAVDCISRPTRKTTATKLEIENELENKIDTCMNGQKERLMEISP